MPIDHEIRQLVRAVVDGVLDPEANEGEVPDVPSDESNPTTIAIGADHGGFPLKERLAFRLREQGYEVTDCGTDSHDSVDYPDFAHRVARKVASGAVTWGIIVDGAGIGSAMVANKVPGVRAALAYDLSSARNSREHNHANVLTLGAGLIGESLAWQIVEAWLSTPWASGRHARRVAMIDDIERGYRGSNGP